MEIVAFKLKFQFVLVVIKAKKNLTFKEINLYSSYESVKLMIKKDMTNISFLSWNKNNKVLKIFTDFISFIVNL